MSQIKRGNTWYAVIKVDGKNVKRPAGPTKASAVALEGKMRREIAEARDRENMGLPPTPPEAPTLADWMDYYLALPTTQAKADLRQRKARSKTICASIGTLRLPAVSPQVVQGLVAEWLRSGLSNATCNRYVALLKRALSEAVRMGKVQVNPLQKFGLLKEDNMRAPCLSEAEEAALIEASPAWMRPVIAIALATGARQGEINELQWGNVDLNRRIIQFKTSKAGGYRQIPIPSSLVQILLPLRQPTGYVVMVPPGSGDKYARKEAYNPRNEAISHSFKVAATKIGRGDLRFHDLRHIAASRLHEQGAGAFDLQSFLGHKTLIVTRRYTLDSVPRLRGLIDATDKVHRNAQKQPGKEK